MGLANDCIVLDEDDYESCGTNHNAQFPGCSGEHVKASLLAICAFI